MFWAYNLSIHISLSYIFCNIIIFFSSKFLFKIACTYLFRRLLILSNSIYPIFLKLPLLSIYGNKYSNGECSKTLESNKSNNFLVFLLLHFNWVDIALFNLFDSISLSTIYEIKDSKRFH